MQKLKKLFSPFIVLIISIPSFLSLLNNSFFSMHDYTHIARLFLLDKGLGQGYLFPRWVDMMGYNFGYPWFNFYPPLVYYVAEFFHKVGFSLIWSIKLTFITGFILSAYGIFLLTKKFIGRKFAFLSSIFYTYFFYHGVLIYVRGALAEFFSLAILPFVFLGLENLKEKPSLKNSVFLSIPIALLILTHPLIAFPTIIYIFLFLIFYLMYRCINTLKHFLLFLFSGLTALSLSAFYWLPSMIEKKFTLVDSVFNKELSFFNLHYICFKQYLISNWGYGGSIAGCADGLTFQIGKTHILALLLSIIGAGLFIFQRHFVKTKLKYYFFFLFLTLFSFFMATSASSIIWNKFSYLSYLQFPWRFLTFGALFISITSAYGIYLLFKVIDFKFKNKNLSLLFVILYGAFTIFLVGRYFIPQNYINKSDRELTTLDEISWRVSNSTFEFAPKGIETVKSDLNTTIPNIQMIDIPKETFDVIQGEAEVKHVENKFMNKKFLVTSDKSIIFRLNTFNFPGWKAYINNEEIIISDDNDFKLITVIVPKGNNLLEFKFENTPVRDVGNIISLVSLVYVGYLLLSFKLKKMKR